MTTFGISAALAVACIAGIAGAFQRHDLAGGIGSAIGLGFCIVGALNAANVMSH